MLMKLYSTEAFHGEREHLGIAEAICFFGATLADDIYLWSVLMYDLSNSSSALAACATFIIFWALLFHLSYTLNGLE